MNKLSRVFIALAVSASAIVVPHALAQRTTTATERCQAHARRGSRLAK